MKLIVGLGNPGKEYENTRHNIGFTIIDSFATNKSVNITTKKFDGLYGEFNHNGEKIILLKPQKYMNLSGEVVGKYVDYFKIDIDNILIISDDLDMNFGKYKLKPEGSSGGHNGLKNIEYNLATQNYKRLKFGIANNKNIETKDYVLSKFNKEEKEIISSKLPELNKLLEDYLFLEFNRLMNNYNNN